MNNKMTINMYQSISTLNVNWLNSPIISYRVADCIRKQDPHICCLKKKERNQLKRNIHTESKVMENILHAN